jgi:hypothetical protein
MSYMYIQLTISLGSGSVGTVYGPNRPDLNPTKRVRISNTDYSQCHGFWHFLIFIGSDFSKQPKQVIDQYEGEAVVFTVLEVSNGWLSQLLEWKNPATSKMSHLLTIFCL